MLAFTSCDGEKDNGDQPKTFYDLKGFMEEQIIHLNREKPLVSKSLAIGKEQSQISSRDIDWKKELELFVQADINKPAYRNSYNIIRPDPLTYEYVLKEGEKIPVRFLRIKLDRADGLPLKIEAMLESENKLYKSEKKINLVCMIENDKAKIISYNIEGFQKLVTMDARPFKIDARVKP